VRHRQSSVYSNGVVSAAETVTVRALCSRYCVLLQQYRLPLLYHPCVSVVKHGQQVHRIADRGCDPARHQGREDKIVHPNRTSTRCNDPTTCEATHRTLPHLQVSVPTTCLPCNVLAGHDIGGNISIGQIKRIKPVITPVPQVEVVNIIQENITYASLNHRHDSLRCVRRVKPEWKQLRLCMHKILELN